MIEFDKAVSAEIEKRVAVREQELTQLAVDLSRQSQQLKEREVAIAERELELNCERDQSLVSNEPVATATQARREMAEEFARQQALWQEWNSTYRRSMAHLKSQLDSLEQQRATFRDEALRLECRRTEIQRMQAECENERRELAEARSKAAKELAELHSLRASLEAERRQRKPGSVNCLTPVFRELPEKASCQTKDNEFASAHSAILSSSDPLTETVIEIARKDVVDRTDDTVLFETDETTFVFQSSLEFEDSPVFVEHRAIKTPTNDSALAELPDGIRQAVFEHCHNGKKLEQIGQDDEALDQYATAWELLPNPKNQWQAAISILIAAVDVFFKKRDFVVAREILKEFVESTAVEINPFIAMRYGQSLFETEDFEAAFDVLEAISRTNGEDLFVNEDPKYLEFVKTQMISMAPVRSANTTSLVNPPHRVALVEHCKNEL